jgi:hypothetical protein
MPSDRMAVEGLIETLTRKAASHTAHGPLTSDDRQLIRWTVYQLEERGVLFALASK